MNATGLPPTPDTLYEPRKWAPSALVAASSAQVASDHKGVVEKRGQKWEGGVWGDGVGVPPCMVGRFTCDGTRTFLQEDPNKAHAGHSPDRRPQQ